jgi:S-formylglutathione hydrolase FrmB
VPFAGVSLLHGVLPGALAVAALGALAMSAIGDRRWLGRYVVPIVVASFLVVVVINRVLDLQARFDQSIPWTFLIWATMPVVALALAFVGWRGEARWRRAVAVAAVPLTLAFAANLINQYYGYDPTVGALFDANVDHQVSSARLGLHQAAATPAVSPAPVGFGSAPRATGRAPAAAPVPQRTQALVPNVDHGVVTTIAIPGTISAFHARDAYVWVPPAFFQAPRPQLPVVMMLAGVPGQPANLIRAGNATIVADSYASSHGGRAPILVFPDANGSFTGDTECVDGPRENADTYLTEDVPRFVESAFSSAAGPARWATLGFSAGGTCAMELALGHPDVFGTFVDIEGDAFPNLGTRSNARALAIAGLYGGNATLFDAHDPLQLAKRSADRGVAAWFETGARDQRKQVVAATINAALRADGLDSRVVQVSGGHDFGVAKRAIMDSFGWLVRRLTPPGS